MTVVRTLAPSIFFFSVVGTVVVLCRSPNGGVVSAFSATSPMSGTHHHHPMRRRRRNGPDKSAPSSSSSSSALSSATHLPSTTDTHQIGGSHSCSRWSLSSLQAWGVPVALDALCVEEDDDFDPLLTDPHVQSVLGFLGRNGNNDGRSGVNYVYVPDSNNAVFGTAAIVVLLAAAARVVGASVAAALTSAIGGGRRSGSSHRTDRDDDHDDGQTRSPDGFWDHRERVATPDGDWFHADTKYASSRPADEGDGGVEDISKTTKPLVILLHGLESNSEGGVAIEMARSVVETTCDGEGGGMDCVCLNFRGCSGRPNDTLRFYHLGFTDDVLHYLTLVRARRPLSPVYLTGFSLGANVVLKCLGDLGASAVLDHHIAGAAVLCAPLDQRRNAPVMHRPGINDRVYGSRLLRSLQAKADAAYERFGGRKIGRDGDEEDDDDGTPPLPFDYAAASAATTITQFDDAFTAPIYGFTDVWDYYDKTSSVHVLDRIAVPTLILNAADDPFFDETFWPVEKSCNHHRHQRRRDDNDGPDGEGGGGPDSAAIQAATTTTTTDGVNAAGAAPPAPVVMHRTRHGGHLGFCLHRVGDRNDARLLRGSSAPSWAALQQAQFLRNVEADPRTAQLRAEKRELRPPV